VNPEWASLCCNTKDREPTPFGRAAGAQLGRHRALRPGVLGASKLAVTRCFSQQSPESGNATTGVFSQKSKSIASPALLFHPLIRPCRLEAGGKQNLMMTRRKMAPLTTWPSQQ